MHSTKKQKVVSFYGKATPRPTVLLDKDHEPIRNRVDAPEPITGALLGAATTCHTPCFAAHLPIFTTKLCLTSEWAKAVPESRGGARPVFRNAPRPCLTAFGALVRRVNSDHLVHRSLWGTGSAVWLLGHLYLLNCPQVEVLVPVLGARQAKGAARGRYAHLLRFRDKVFAARCKDSGAEGVEHTF